MATRSIVTSQPDVACDVCGRRLLRGESPDTFLAGREPRTVCELCAPRAAQEGWLRETDSDPLSIRPPRSRRGVSLLDRLRQLREPIQRRPLSRSSDAFFEQVAETGSLERELYLGAVVADRPATPVGPAGGFEPAGPGPAGGFEPAGPTEAPADAHDPDLARVLEVFNRGEQPRRVAGVARSLGVPSVSVQAVEGSASRFTVVVAWELCWYRYEVDLDDELAGATMVEKGMELDELPVRERLGNAAANDHGELHLVG